MTAGPVLGVSAIVERDDAVLLIQRGPGTYGGLWSLPGGKVDAGERLAQALAREVLEETGLRVSVGTFAALHEELPGPRVAGHYVILVYRATITGGQLRAGDDAEQAEWVPTREVRRRRTTPGLLQALRTAGVRA